MKTLIPASRLALAALATIAMTATFSTTAQAAAPTPVDDWASVLERFVDDQGLVDYQGLNRDRAALDRYVTWTEKTSPDNSPDLFPTRNEKLAYYLNAYNAQVFKGVLSRGPEEKSVWSGLISGYTFFQRMKITIGGKKMSLKTLEDKCVREEFNDPRVHAALNCASIGCPRLPREPFAAERLDEQLDDAMREFATTERHVKVNAASKTVELSKIFDWFEGDFLEYLKSQGQSKPVILNYINRYRPADDQIPTGYAVSYIPYDKAVNKQ